MLDLDLGSDGDDGDYDDEVDLDDGMLMLIDSLIH